MTAQPWLEKVTARDLALSVFKRPDAHAGLIAGRVALPDDVIDVIRLAKEAADHRGEPAYDDEFHQAALFFVEHVLLGSGGDHYRTLGVTRVADPRTVREHYRLLVAIFHPDRGPWPAGCREDLTARLNVAYRVLKDPVARGAYDTDRGRSKTIQMGGGGPAPQRCVDPVEEALPEPFLSRFPPVVQRNFPQFVLGVVAFLGCLLVLGVYLNRAPPEAIGMGATTSAGSDHGAPYGHLLGRAREPLLARVETVAANVEPDRIGSEHRPGLTLPDHRPGSSGKPDRSSTDQAAEDVPGNSGSESPFRIASEREAAKSDGALRSKAVAPEVGARQETGPVIDLSHVETSSSVGEEAASRLNVRTSGGGQQQGGVAPGSRAEGATPSLVVAPDAKRTETGLRQAEVVDLLNRFAMAYRNARLEELMDLFADDARSNSGNRDGIHRDYDDLFRLTNARDIEFHDFEWDLDGNHGTGRGTYVARVLPAGRSSEDLHLGSVRLSVVKSNGRARIRELFHRTD